MKTILCSMMDDNFLPGFVGFVKSARKNSPCVFNYEWVFIDVGLTEPVKKEMLSYYSNIKFVKPRYDRYENIKMNRTSERLKNTYYTLDVFGMTDCSHIVFIDMDVLILGDISLLFTIDKPISGVLAYTQSNDSLRSSINSGVFVVNRQFINELTYSGILRLAQQGFSMPDQKAINKFFHGRIYLLPKEYNMEKRIINSKRFDWKKARILHFVSHKPWDKGPISGNNRGFEEMEKLWKDYYNG